MDKEMKIAVFNERKIRKVFHNEEWWFAIVDVVSVLTDSKDPVDYLKKLRLRDDELAALLNPDPVDKGGGQIVPPLSIPLETEGGTQKVRCWNTEGIFRLIQSIPSRKAEPFKRWLAKVGYERIQEIENPELASERMREIYRAKGYSEDWINKRVRGIAVRDELTGEWEERGVEIGKEYAIVTSDNYVETSNSVEELGGS